MDKATEKKLADHELRIKRIEKTLKDLNAQPSADVAVEQIDAAIVEKQVESKPSEPSAWDNITFTQVITFLGIVGIVIGLLSLFFYAVSNRWIPPTAQIVLGMAVGFALFAFAYMLREKNISWSNTVFGGAYLIEYISIGVGVLTYKVMPTSIGVFFAVVILVSALALALKFNSRMIAYFAVAGGYILPFITYTFKSNSFMLTWYILLSAGLALVSFRKEWADLRFTSFALTIIFTLGYTGSLIDGRNVMSSVLFLVALFALFHVSAIINSLTNPKSDISGLDSVMLVVSPIILLGYLFPILDWSAKAFGLLVMVYALLQLVEVYMLKQRDISASAVYSLISTGFVALNIGLIMLLYTGFMRHEYCIVLFAVEQALFAYLASNVKDESILYRVFSYLFLALTAVWMFILATAVSYNGLGQELSTIYTVISIAVTASFFVQMRQRIDFYVNAAAFIISGFLTLYTISQYIGPIFNITSQTSMVILSVFWLAYTISLYSQVITTPGKILVGSLLGITLLKIAFYDLFLLHGAFRIIGFIIFGVLLLIGGYFVRK